MSSGDLFLYPSSPTAATAREFKFNQTDAVPGSQHTLNDCSLTLWHALCDIYRVEISTRLTHKLSGNCDDSILCVILVIATVAAFGGWTYFTITNGSLCDAYSGHIPGTLPAMLQKVVPHTCPTLH